MSRVVSVKTAQFVKNRARSLCEYCKVPDAEAFIGFQVDHILAQVHGGDDDADNLAWSCAICNGFKGPNLASIDPETSKVTVLYHPRREKWNVHFRLSEGYILPKTAKGRATILLLKMNLRETCILRRTLEQIDPNYATTVRLPPFR